MEHVDPNGREAGLCAAGEASYAVEAERIVRRFGKVEALADVTLRIRKGEFFSLLGPSGCGKTTLLRLIAGLDIQDSGELRIHGLNASEIPAHKRPVNTVFQSYALFPHMTAWDNIAFGLRMKGLPKTEIHERVERILTTLEVGDFARRRPAQLSGGQKQRVALARAVVNEPSVLLLDEPLGALDLKLRKQLQIELHQLQKRLGITFVYVTHDQDEALVMSDRIAVMNCGRVEQLDTAEDLYERPRTRFVAEFLGACNLITGTIAHVTASRTLVKTQAGQVMADTTRSNRAVNPGDTVTLAIRPEKIRFASDSSQTMENRLPVTIQELVYSGAETQFWVRSGQQTLRMTALNYTSVHGHAVGASATCEFAAQACVILTD